MLLVLVAATCRHADLYCLPLCSFASPAVHLSLLSLLRCYGTFPWKQNLTLLRYLSLKAKPYLVTVPVPESKPYVVTVPVPESKTLRCYGTCPWKQNFALLRYLSESKTLRCYDTCPWKENLTLLRYLSLKAKVCVFTVPVWKQKLALLRYLSLKVKPHVTALVPEILCRCESSSLLKRSANI